MEPEKLPFRMLINDDSTHAAGIAQSMRIKFDYNKEVFIQKIQGLSKHDFDDYCKQIVSWQDFAYQLAGSVGTESEDNIPEGQEALFKRDYFRKRRQGELTEDHGNGNDPGIIIQKCVTSNNPREQFIYTIKKMNKEEFVSFCQTIELLAYFAATQSGSFFSHYPSLISDDDDRFWFND
jgi:hypothetical protein